MCLALLKKAGSHITRKQLTTAWRINDDGAGFMYAQGGKLIVNKGFFNFKKFYQALRCAEALAPKSNFVIHLRLATSGKKDINNCHPFSVNDKLAFVHNGVFRKFDFKNLEPSDTQLFNQEILQNLPSDFLNTSSYVKLLTDYCKTDFSKIIFLDSNGDYTILGEDRGDWRNGIWFSTAPTTSITKWRYDDSIFRDYEPVKSCFICKGYFNEDELTIAPRLNALVCLSCLDFSKNWIKCDEMVCPTCNEIIEVPDNMTCPICEVQLDKRDIILVEN